MKEYNYGMASNIKHPYWRKRYLKEFFMNIKYKIFSIMRKIFNVIDKIRSATVKNKEVDSSYYEWRFLGHYNKWKEWRTSYEEHKKKYKRDDGYFYKRFLW
jgi:hypothetical protein